MRVSLLRRMSTFTWRGTSLISHKILVLSLTLILSNMIHSLIFFPLMFEEDPVNLWYPLALADNAFRCWKADQLTGLRSEGAYWLSPSLSGRLSRAWKNGRSSLCLGVCNLAVSQIAYHSRVLKRFQLCGSRTSSLSNARLMVIWD